MSAIPPNNPMSDTQQLARIPSKLDHDIDAYDVLLRVYQKKRIQGQLDFYENRYKEFDTNSSFMVAVGAAIMALSAVLSAFGASRNSAELALCTAILPAFAALVAALRQLYQWEKQSALYKDAWLGLQEAVLIVPDTDMFDRRTANVVTPRLINAAEEVFNSEINQWGQIALGLEDKTGDDELNRRLRELEIEDRITQSVGGGAFSVTMTPPNDSSIPSGSLATPFVSSTPTITGLPPIPAPEENPDDDDNAVG